MLTNINKEENYSLTVCRKGYTDLLAEEYNIQWPLQPECHGIRYVCYYKDDNSLLISNVVDGQLVILDLNNGTFKKHQLHSTTIRKIAIYKTAEGPRIITSSWDGSCKVTNYNTFENILTLTSASMGRTPHFKLSHDARYLFSFSYDSDLNAGEVSNTVRQWSMYDGSLVKIFPASDCQKTTNRSGSCELSDNRLYIVSDSGYFKVYDVDTGVLIHEIITNGNFRMCSLYREDFIIAADSEGFIYLYDIKRNILKLKSRFDYADIYCLRIHPQNPDIIFVTGYYGKIKVVNLPDFQIINTIDTGSYQLWSMDFKDDLLFIGNIHHEVMIYNIRDLENIIFKGKISLLDTCFVIQIPESKMFYASDISDLEIVKTEDQVKVEGKEALNLLTQFNNPMILKELFGSSENFRKMVAAENKPLLLIK
jgi:WD40 repeat protein